MNATMSGAPRALVRVGGISGIDVMAMSSPTM
jgi:hypothetical protein